MYMFILWNQSTCTCSVNKIYRMYTFPLGDDSSRITVGDGALWDFRFKRSQGKLLSSSFMIVMKYHPYLCFMMYRFMYNEDVTNIWCVIYMYTIQHMTILPLKVKSHFTLFTLKYMYNVYCMHLYQCFIHHAHIQIYLHAANYANCSICISIHLVTLYVHFLSLRIQINTCCIILKPMNEARCMLHMPVCCFLTPQIDINSSQINLCYEINNNNNASSTERKCWWNVPVIQSTLMHCNNNATAAMCARVCIYADLTRQSFHSAIFALFRTKILHIMRTYNIYGTGHISHYCY